MIPEDTYISPGDSMLDLNYKLDFCLWSDLRQVTHLLSWTEVRWWQCQWRTLHIQQSKVHLNDGLYSALYLPAASCLWLFPGYPGAVTGWVYASAYQPRSHICQIGNMTFIILLTFFYFVVCMHKYIAGNMYICEHKDKLELNKSAMHVTTPLVLTYMT